ncbi:MAG: HupU protein, partial [Betaproteobacteria bacterium HGW-Betaproteobacteria-13]
MNVLWLQSGGCGGCTMSLLCAESPDVLATLEGGGVSLLWHPSLSEASGREAVAILESCIAGTTPLDVLCVEGALLRGPHGSGRFHVLAGTGQAMIDWVRALAARARHTVAVGTCAAFGGVTAAAYNPTDACGLQYDGNAAGGLLGADYRSASGLPVINVAGCPTHPGWVLETLLALALDGIAAADLDSLGRPRFYADQLVHHGCSRNEFYEFKASAEKASDLGCMMEHMGCKG